jgi:hypothetical protein
MVRSSSSIENLRRVLEADRTADLPIEWILEGVKHWLRPGADLKLTACLGLPSKAKSIRGKLRDSYLAEAALLLRGGPWDRAKALLGEIRRFRHGKLARWGASGVPIHAPENEVALFRAFNLGAPIPTTVQGLWKILSNTPSVDQTENASSFGGLCVVSSESAPRGRANASE